jgi:N-acetyl-gamma-glutamyl-phosphate/LysW-gamma-L-alpha-aminoadipyl-6-phosphate reductase
VSVRAAIVGGTGYGGMELLRYLLDHPEIEVATITSRTETGSVADVHPHLRGLTDLAFTARRAVDLAREHDLLFFAAPHGVAAKEVGAVLEADPRVKVVDLSGDFRLKDAAAYPEVYGYEHPAPALLSEAAYGLPECGGRASVADGRRRLVANPGCHATAAVLALWPLVRGKVWRGAPTTPGSRAVATVVSVTGSSGSGATPGQGTHHPERFSNFRAYKPLRHQHLPEIRQALVGQGMSERAFVAFVPCSAPFARGIVVTATVDVRGEDAGAPEAGDFETHVRGAVAAAYAEEPFVRQVPETAEARAVAGTNFADVGVAARDDVVCVSVAIDNLGKGMAGTAVQNANLLFGLPETTGLRRAGAGL